jgi:copper chaperone CopZ
MNRNALGMLALTVVAISMLEGTAHARKPNMTAIFVGDMHCSECAQKIANKLYTVKGVSKVSANLKTGIAYVTPAKEKKLSPRALWEAVEKADFTPIKLEGPSGKFMKKPKK